jgi:hypothetical protein
VLCLLCRAGVAPDAVAKAEATDWLRSNRLVPSCDAEPVCTSEAPGGHICFCLPGICFGEIPSEALACEREDRQAKPDAPNDSRPSFLC